MISIVRFSEAALQRNIFKHFPMYMYYYVKV